MWNYRVVKIGTVYGISEVYYDDDGNPKWYTDHMPAVVDEYESGSLGFQLAMMQKALTKPVLVATDDNKLVVESLPPLYMVVEYTNRNIDRIAIAAALTINYRGYQLYINPYNVEDFNEYIAEDLASLQMLDMFAATFEHWDSIFTRVADNEWPYYYKVLHMPTAQCFILFNIFGTSNIIPSITDNTRSNIAKLYLEYGDIDA